MKKQLIPPLVMIEWEDSVHGEGGWQWLDELSIAPTAHCKSVGFLIKDTKQVKCLALTMAGYQEGRRPQVTGIISIPTRAVLKLERLVT